MCVFVFVCAGWSAPSAIGIAGLGGGFEIGVEVNEHTHTHTHTHTHICLVFSLTGEETLPKCLSFTCKINKISDTMVLEIRGFTVFLHWFGSFLETEITFSKL